MNGCEHCRHYWNNGKGDENCEINGWDLNSIGCSYYDDSRISIIIPQEFQKPQTNADHIRSLTDEKLAVFLATTTAKYCSWRDTLTEEQEKWLKWLKQEAK